MRLLRVAGTERTRPLPSDSNDAWLIGDVALRICYRGDRKRFEREALVAAAMPASVKVPQLLEQGSDGEVAWQVSELVAGVPLGVAWPALAVADRRVAIRQVGEFLAALNAHPFRPAVRAALASPRQADGPTAASVIGADLNPLPVSRAQLLLEPAARLSGVDENLIDLVGERFRELEATDPAGDSALADSGGGVVVHGDAHPMNVLWNDGVVALLDGEWVRLGGIELEIEPFLYRGLDSAPSLLADSARIMGWLSDAHPAAFAAPDLVLRVWLIELATHCGVCCYSHLTARSVTCRWTIRCAGSGESWSTLTTSSGSFRVRELAEGRKWLVSREQRGRCCRRQAGDLDGASARLEREADERHVPQLEEIPSLVGCQQLRRSSTGTTGTALSGPVGGRMVVIGFGVDEPRHERRSRRHAAVTDSRRQR